MVIHCESIEVGKNLKKILSVIFVSLLCLILLAIPMSKTAFAQESEDESSTAQEAGMKKNLPPANAVEFNENDAIKKRGSHNWRALKNHDRNRFNLWWTGATGLGVPATYWMTGNTLHVDGGENIVG